MKNALTNCPICTGVMPGSVEMEKAVLSCMMQAPVNIGIAAEMLAAKDFTHPQTGPLFSILLHRGAEGLPVDPMAITLDLHNQRMLESFGEPAFISECYTVVPDPSHLKHYASQVKETSRRRELVRLAHKLAAAGVGMGEASEWSTPKEWKDGVSGLQRELEDLLADNNDSGVRQYSEVVLEYSDSLMESGRVDEKDAAVPTGISGLDDALEGGLRREYVIVSGKSGEGKSMGAYQLSGALANAGRAGLAVGLEMTNMQVVMRDLARETQVPLSQVMGRKVLEANNARPLAQSALRLQKDWQITLMDRPRTSWASVVARARDLHRRGKLDWLLVDYIQLLEVKAARGERKDEVLVDLSTDMANLQKELNITLIVPVQINEDGLTAGAKGIIRPCQLLVRIEMNEEEPMDEGHLHILKQRFGPKNRRIPVTREGAFQRFVDRSVFSSPEPPRRQRRPVV